MNVSTSGQQTCDSPDLLDAIFTIIGIEDSLAVVEESEFVVESRQGWPWILSVDDDPCIATALEFRLQQVGINLVRAACGREGIRVASFEAPRLILLDYDLPRENGDLVLQKLKANPSTSRIPVVCLTGHRDRGLEQRMKRLGAIGYVTKPYCWQILWQTIEENLNPVPA